MSLTHKTPDWTTKTLTDLSPDDPLPLVARDRSTPVWAAALSLLFSLGIGVCFVAIAVFAMFYLDLVALQGQEILASLLTLGALVPILGILLFEVGHAKALSGYRYLRTRNSRYGMALAAGLATGGMAFIHPLVVVPFALSIALSGAVVFPLARALPMEKMWDFLPQEAVPFLSGRDARAHELANMPGDSNALIDGLLRAVRLLSFIGALAIGSWLAAREVVALPAIASVALITYWSAGVFAALFRQMSRIDPEFEGRAHQVTLLPSPIEDGGDGDGEDANAAGLVVHDLSVSTSDGMPVLSDISFRAAPGAIIGLCGDAFAGKSLLATALVAPHDLTNLTVQGFVSISGELPWIRSARDRGISTVLVPPRPLSVPGDGMNNLGCFVSEQDGRRARRILKSLVHNVDTVDHICRARDVHTLSATEQKALVLARALFLRPQLYVIDRPEDGASQALMRAFASRLEEESRLGSIILMATENRQLLEKCDKLMMMQNGRMIELAPADEIRARTSAGWVRFVSERNLDSEDALDSWICAQFRRQGDEGNRRNVCMVANELLAFACQAQSEFGHSATVSFEFKHFKGHCVVRLTEMALPVSSAALEKARLAADAANGQAKGGTLSPLARVLQYAETVETCELAGNQVLQVTIETYDPRVSKAPKAKHHDSQNS